MIAPVAGMTLRVTTGRLLYPVNRIRLKQIIQPQIIQHFLQLILTQAIMNIRNINHIERFNNPLRQRVSRLVRQTLNLSPKNRKSYQCHSLLHRPL
jgi:hypothetical protein